MYPEEQADMETQATQDSTVLGSEVDSDNLDWKSSLPSDLANDPTIAQFKDVESLAKTVVHQQKQGRFWKKARLSARRQCSATCMEPSEPLQIRRRHERGLREQLCKPKYFKMDRLYLRLQAARCRRREKPEYVRRSNV